MQAHRQYNAIKSDLEDYVLALTLKYGLSLGNPVHKEILDHLNAAIESADSSASYAKDIHDSND